MTRIHLDTPRLRLWGADAAVLHAELAGRDALAQSLGFIVPPAWPPEHLDESAIRWTLDRLATLPADTTWRFYYLEFRGTAIGTAGYKGPPDGSGTAEVGYSVLPGFQHRGFATEAVMALIGNAFAQGARRVIAETYPDLIASRRVMEKCGMTLEGPGSEGGTIRYGLERPAGEHRTS